MGGGERTPIAGALPVRWEPDDQLKSGAGDRDPRLEEGEPRAVVTLPPAAAQWDSLGVFFTLTGALSEHKSEISRMVG